MKLLLALLLIVQLAECISRSHIALRRPHHEDLHLYGEHRTEPTEEMSFFVSEEEVTIQYDDGTEIEVEYQHYVDDSDTIMSTILFDVHINRRFTHTCIFRAPNHQEGIILHIIKEGRKVQIAESSVSACTSASEIDQTHYLKKNTKVKSHGRYKNRLPDLRISLLKKSVDMSKYKKPIVQKKFRWLDSE